MEAAKGAGEHDALQALSMTPPDQWGTLLQTLGASFQPVQNDGEGEAPFTVTSLLGMMEQMEASQQPVAAPAKVQQTAPAQGAARTRRRGPRAAAAGGEKPAPAEEDTRDLEELLRGLGETALSSEAKGQAQAKKKAAKGAARRAKEANPLPPEPSPASEPEPRPCAGKPAVAAAPAPQSPALRSMAAPSGPDAGEAVAEAADGDFAEDGDEAWQTVASRAARRALRAQEPAAPAPSAEAPGEGSTTAEEEEEVEEEEEEDEKPGEDFRDGVAAAAAALADVGADRAAAGPAEEAAPTEPAPTASAPAAAPAEAAAAAAEAAVAAEPPAKEEERQEMEQYGTGGPCRRKSRRSLSEGCRPQADQDSEDEDVGDGGRFLFAPSVATWLSRPLAPRQPPAERPPPLDPVGRGRGSSREVEAETLYFEVSEDPAVTEASWHARPSVGTWLLRSRSPTASPQAASARGRSREPQLWPATPEDTPPASPRGHADSGGGHQQVVWMPVPAHLMAEVQKLIQFGSLAAAAAAP